MNPISNSNHPHHIITHPQPIPSRAHTIPPRNMQSHQMQYHKMQSDSNAAAAGLSRCVAADVYCDVVDCDYGFGPSVRANHIVVDVVIVMLLGVLMCFVLLMFSISMMGVQITRSLSMCGWCDWDDCCTVIVCVMLVACRVDVFG